MAYIEENIDDLPPAGALTGAELLELLQSSVNVNVTLALLKGYINKKALVVATSSGGILELNCALGRNFKVTLFENVTSIVVTGTDGASFVTDFDVQFEQDGTGGFTVALPASFKALGGSDTEVALAPNAVTVLSAKTFDNGITWRYAMQESA